MTEVAVTASCPTPYRRRRPERTLLYRTVQTHFATWLALTREGAVDGDPVPAHVEREFRRYLTCGILAHGFARARCGDCGHHFLIAFSCKGRGVCPSCNTRRMVATAAHLADHVIPRLPVRQWVLAVPKRLRYFLQRDPDLQGAALRLFLRAVEQCLRARSADAGPAARIGAVAFIHRFGAALNPHLHFHCVVLDGVFAPAPAGGVVFHEATGPDEQAIAAVQAKVRRQLLGSFVRRGLLDGDAAHAMQAWQHGGGFSVDASVRIEAADRAGRERLLRYCARPPFALERLQQRDAEHLLYEATMAAGTPATTAPAAPPANAAPPTAEPAHRRAARYAWALLLARIYEVFPLRCPTCGGDMRIIAFITEAAVVRDILIPLGEPITPPTIAPARGPPLWEMPQAGQPEIEQAQPAPDYAFDQRIAW